MKKIFHFFFLFLFGLLFAVSVIAQPTPADATVVVSDGMSLEYIEYSGTIQFAGDSAGARYSKPFAINRFASGPVFLSLVSSNPKEDNGVKVLVDFQVTPQSSGTSGYVTIDDTLSIKTSKTSYLILGATNEPAYNMGYWGVIKVSGLSSANRDSTAIKWRLRGYRPVASTRAGQVKN